MHAEYQCFKDNPISSVLYNLLSNNKLHNQPWKVMRKIKSLHLLEFALEWLSCSTRAFCFLTWDNSCRHLSRSPSALCNLARSSLWTTALDSASLTKALIPYISWELPLSLGIAMAKVFISSINASMLLGVFNKQVILEYTMNSLSLT